MVKKFISLILIVTTVLSLAACQSVPKDEEFSLNAFESEVTVTLNEQLIKAKLSYESPTNINLTFTEPESLKDMNVKIENGEKILSLGEVKMNLTQIENFDLNDNLITSLYEVLGNFGSSSQMIAKSGKIELDGNTVCGDYFLTFDCDNKKITNISTDEFLYIFT